MPDKWFLQVKFFLELGYKINLKFPKTFNEKLQWIKLYDRNPFYTTLVDKLLVKQFVSIMIGPEFVIPTLAVFKSVDDIELDKLPDKFVLKCNHDSGSVVICRDKNSFDLDAAKHILKKSIEQDFYLLAREWPYKNVKRCVFAEQYLENYESKEQNKTLIDYKFFCFDGIPKVMYIGSDKSLKPTSDFFDMNYNHLPITIVDPNADICPQKPICFEKMKELASALSQDIPHVRVDFYYINGKIYFGEFTFFHMGGFSPIRPDEWNIQMGNWITVC